MTRPLELLHPRIHTVHHTAHRTGRLEDDGTLLVVSRDANRNETALLAIDARKMEVVARIAAPIRTPFEFHGQFFMYGNSGR